MVLTLLSNYAYDGFGNHYINRKTINPESGDIIFNANPTIHWGISTSEINNYINSLYTTIYGDRVNTNTTATTFSILFNHPEEVLSPPANMTSNRRFTIQKFYNSPGHINTQINTSQSLSPQIISTDVAGATTFSSTTLFTSYYFATCNQYSINQFYFDALLRRSRFRSTGWGYQRVSGLSYGPVYDLYTESGYGASQSPFLFWVTSTDTTTTTFRSEVSERNSNYLHYQEGAYSISCADGQSSNNIRVSNFPILETRSGSTIRCTFLLSSNVLLAKSAPDGSTLEIGKVYKIPNVGENLNATSNFNANPNTDCPFFMCVGNWFGPKILMRIATEGYN